MMSRRRNNLVVALKIAIVFSFGCLFLRYSVWAVKWGLVTENCATVMLGEVEEYKGFVEGLPNVGISLYKLPSGGFFLIACDAALPKPEGYFVNLQKCSVWMTHPAVFCRPMPDSNRAVVEKPALPGYKAINQLKTVFVEDNNGCFRIRIVGKRLEEYDGYGKRYEIAEKLLLYQRTLCIQKKTL